MRQFPQQQPAGGAGQAKQQPFAAEYPRRAFSIKNQSDPRGLDRATHGRDVVRNRCSQAALEILNSAEPDTGSLRKLALRPPQPCAGGSALLWGHWLTAFMCFA